MQAIRPNLERDRRGPDINSPEPTNASARYTVSPLGGAVWTGLRSVVTF